MGKPRASVRVAVRTLTPAKAADKLTDLIKEIVSGLLDGKAPTKKRLTKLLGEISSGTFCLIPITSRTITKTVTRFRDRIISDIIPAVSVTAVPRPPPPPAAPPPPVAPPSGYGVSTPPPPPAAPPPPVAPPSGYGVSTQVGGPRGPFTYRITVQEAAALGLGTFPGTHVNVVTPFVGNLRAGRAIPDVVVGPRPPPPPPSVRVIQPGPPGVTVPGGRIPILGGGGSLEFAGRYTPPERPRR